MERSSSYQIVTLESFYDSWQNPIVQSLFPKIIYLKCQGYFPLYKYGALPFDTTDFFATHHLLCEKNGNELNPIMGFKTVDLKRTDLYRIKFPALSIPQTSGAKKHEKIIEKIMGSVQSRNSNLNYGFSWTIHQKVRQDLDLKKFLKDIFCTILVHYYKNRPDEEHLCLGVHRFKTDQFFLWMGYEPLTENQKILPSFELSSLQNEKVQMFHATQFSNEAVNLAKQYELFWRNRLLIAENIGNEKLSEKKAA